MRRPCSDCKSYQFAAKLPCSTLTLYTGSICTKEGENGRSLDRTHRTSRRRIRMPGLLSSGSSQCARKVPEMRLERRISMPCSRENGRMGKRRRRKVLGPRPCTVRSGSNHGSGGRLSQRRSQSQCRPSSYSRLTAANWISPPSVRTLFRL